MPLLILLNKWFPQDEILLSSEPLADQDQNDDDEEAFDDRKSIGMITRLEQFDHDVAQKFLRRDGGDDYQEDVDFEVKVVESSPEKRMENVKSSELFSPVRQSRLSVT